MHPFLIKLRINVPGRHGPKRQYHAAAEFFCRLTAVCLKVNILILLEFILAPILLFLSQNRYADRCAFEDCT
jgi:hypothetical protein